MNIYTTPFARLPNPGLPPEGFPPMKERFGDYALVYNGNQAGNINYKLPGLKKEKIILPRNIDSKIEDYKPVTLEQMILN